MPKLKTGDKAPAFKLLDQNESQITLNNFAGRKLFIFFYPKASTSG